MGAIILLVQHRKACYFKLQPSSTVNVIRVCWSRLHGNPHDYQSHSRWTLGGSDSLRKLRINHSSGVKASNPIKSFNQSCCLSHTSYEINKSPTVSVKLFGYKTQAELNCVKVKPGVKKSYNSPKN